MKNIHFSTTSSKGFTLVELMIVIIVLAFLAIITLVAINPAQQFAKSNNTKRRSNVSAILNALKQYSANKNGLSALSIPHDTELLLNSSGSTGTINLCTELTPKFIPRMPYDPETGFWQSCSNYNTGYILIVDANGRFRVTAPAAELGEEIFAIQ